MGNYTHDYILRGKTFFIIIIDSLELNSSAPCDINSTREIKHSKGFEPGSDSRLCRVIVRVRVVLKRTVVGDSD